ncbi:MAG: ribosome silencing factor [Christensenellales bacterium]|jgi:ribosome-associated protein
MKPKELALAIAGILDSKKADKITILEVNHLTTIADYFVIASGRNAIQVRAMAEDVEDGIAEERQIPARRKEGYNEGRWIVLDYASVIVHIFHQEEREFYNIERLWMDGSNQVPFVAAPQEVQGGEEK